MPVVHRHLITGALGILLLVACGSGSPAPAANSTPTATPAGHETGNVNCPDGQRPRAGLVSFGAFIGTWQGLHHQNPATKAEYTIQPVPGRITIRCSTDNHVIVEQISLSSPIPADQALQVALRELPEDAKQVYDHPHPNCRTFQYQSKDLAAELAGDDVDGRVGVSLESASASYDGNAVTLILIDLLDKLGQDTQGC